MKTFAQIESNLLSTGFTPVGDHRKITFVNGVHALEFASNTKIAIVVHLGLGRGYGVSIYDNEVSTLRKRLSKIEAQLNKNRANVLEDGWQTQKHSKKSRNWDLLAIAKHEINVRLNELGAL